MCKFQSLCQAQGAYLAEVGDSSEEAFLVQVGPVAHQGRLLIVQNFIAKLTCGCGHS